MSSNPQISVIMSVYNGSKYLAEAIDSILNQSFTNFEFIIINDGSTDRTESILKTYTDERICLIKNHKNIGLTASLNKGLQQARAPYIARQDADDMSLPERLQTQFQYLENHPDVGLLGSAVYLIDAQGRHLQKKTMPLDDRSLKKHLSNGNQFCHGSVIFRRGPAVEIGGYRPKAKYVEDFDLWCRIARKHNIHNLSEPLYKLRFHTESVSLQNLTEQRQYDRLIAHMYTHWQKTRQDILDEMSDQELDALRLELFPPAQMNKNKLLSEKYYRIAEVLYNAREYQQALSYNYKAIQQRPVDLSSWILLIKNYIRLAMQKLNINPS